ncbi:D-2-hydroxyacid dehydrogenase [Chelativorans sp.]|uniref:D-2-hydroxyacid dehydrogenase n=1 Tax=Chelativorans sp. TaxID=2203393 RepID=UPI0028114234|nr:D-2-hydroxyacid dehydrogenase [Chelativorans sp.]
MRVLYWGLPHHSPLIDERLRRIEGVELAAVADEAAAMREAAGAEVLVITPNRYTEAVEQAVHASGRLRLVQLLSAGYDPLLGRSFPPGTVVATAGDSLAPAVAEHAVALTLALSRRLDLAFANQFGERWHRAPFSSLGSLCGKTAAVFGFGSIGKAIAMRLRAFGTRVVGVSRSGAPDAAADEMRPFGEIAEVVAQADLILVALPASPETEGLFGHELFRACRKGALLVNIARGRIVDTDALIDALNEGQLGGAALDVTEPEPLPQGHPLWRAPNVIITPHYAGLGAQQELGDFVAQNLERLRAGVPLLAVTRLGGGHIRHSPG